MKEPFNLDRILHRGKYNIDGENKEALKLTFHHLFSKVLGITKDYTTGDKVIAYVCFFQSLILGFFTFLGVIIWNTITPWPLEWWGTYFFIVLLIIPLGLTIISVFWFGIGGVIDLFRLFRDLKVRVDNPLDNGQVEGHVSLADKAQFEEIEHKNLESTEKNND